jgi:putative restriction endonuclease
MTKQALQDLFSKITVWKRGGERAPHKPLLALYALGKCARREGRLIAYSDVDQDLRKLLREFGPTRQSYHPEYPFWRLQNDGIWQLRGAERVGARASSTDAKKSELLRYDVHGGFTEEVYSRLGRDRKLLAWIARDVLDANFPPSIHEDILQAVGLDLEAEELGPTGRDPRFREKVLRAYEYRCALCGFDLRLGDVLVGVEAAHIQWSQAGGPDTEVNGVALCVMHHKLFDRGAFTLTDSMEIQVSERAHGSTGFQEWLMAFHGKPMRPPLRESYYPEAQFTSWHLKEVFQGPSRYVTENGGQ